jgi:hypothetical protein
MPRPYSLLLFVPPVALSSSKEDPAEAPGERGAHYCLVRFPTGSAVM